MDANNLAIGSVVPVFLDGAQVPLRIVAEVASFPTVTAPGGALITDLGSVQEYLARQSLPPLPVTQWWLATAGGGIPPALTASVPAGTDITSAAGLATATAGDPLSAAPQQALLAMAAAAALLAITGFWVSIAADVRRRRGETALLAALGVTRRGGGLAAMPGEAAAQPAIRRSRGPARHARRPAAGARRHAHPGGAAADAARPHAV